MKKIRIVLLCMLMLLAMSTVAMADSGVKIKVDGKLVSDADAEAVLQYGKTLLPVRSIGTALGGEVTWDGATQTAIIEKDDITVVAPIGEMYILVNGEAKNLTAVAQII